MSKIYATSLMIFRRDLRLDDNTALIRATKESKKIIPLFILDPRQIGSKNKFRSMNAMQFMIESLNDLAQQIKDTGGKLYFFSGIAEKVVKQLITLKNIDAVYVNRDYTPFSIKRDKAIAKDCTKQGIEFISCTDELLDDPDDIFTKSGTPYSIFTPYYRSARKISISKPQRTRKFNWFTGSIAKSKSTSVFKTIIKKENKDIWIHGGTKQAKKLLSKLTQLKNYTKTRDIPSIDTSNLSAHLKFGTISIRMAFDTIKRKLGSRHPLLRQLYWRDFYTYVAYHSSFVYGQPYREKYKKLWWSKSKKNFERWCNGETGFPIVDAGMRQLNATGYMHNRVRMIVASFLTKDLHINWLWGEKYFAQQLVDYDPAVNNGNWQWCASTGSDAQPYFRIFNPWLQQKKFDPQCIYIKEWIPELRNIAPKIIHSWNNPKHEDVPNYPRPMIDHAKESAYAKKLFKSV